MAIDLDERERDLRPTDTEREIISHTYDPAPDPVTIAADRTSHLVGNMTSQVLDELRQQRDETDALMEAIRKNDKLLQTAIVEHAGRVTAVIASKVVIAEQLGKLRELFAPVMPVLTQLNGGGQK